MERLTEPMIVPSTGEILGYRLKPGVTDTKLKNKLGAYETAEEQKLLLRLPCKAGDTVWIKGDRFPAEVAEISLDEEGLFFKYVEYDRGHEITEVWDSGFFYADDIGKTVFLTKAEAEKALEEMENEK